MVKIIQPRLADIAKETNVSIATISRYLNGITVRTEFAKRIEQYLKKNKLWNLYAARLNTGSLMRLVGMIVPEISPLFFSSLLQGVLDAALENNILVTLVSSQRSREKERQLLAYLAELPLEALIYAPVAYQPKTAPPELALFDCIPMVVTNRRAILPNRPHVYTDNITAGYLATKYMLSLGRTKVGIIIGTWEFPFDLPILPEVFKDHSQLGGFTNVDRFRGYLKALEEHNIPFDNSLASITSSKSDIGGARSAAELLVKAPYIDGLITTADILSVAAMDTFKKHGYRIPQDISVISWGNNDLIKFTTPSLTSVEYPTYKIGMATIDVIKRLLQNEKVEDVVFDVSITPRESTTILKPEE